MPISDWYPIRNLDLGHSRAADGKWRIEYDDLVARMRVCSNHKAFSDWVRVGLEYDDYRQLAEQIVADLNKPH